MLTRTLGAAALLLASGTAYAQGSSPAEIVQRHVSSGGNIDAIMADYADDAVVLQNGRAIEGKPAIRKLFQNMFGGKRAAPTAQTPSSPPAEAPPKMTVDKVWQEGDVGFVNWHMGPMHATEEFVTKDGKIAVQAIFMTGGPAAAPRG
jgi:ketosteroid isomerase-like protein